MIRRNRTDVESIVMEAYSRSERPDLRDSDLSHVDLAEMVLLNVDLTRSDLTGAYLRSCDLAGAILTGAKLDWACLVGANLTDATMDSVSLRHTDMERVMLAGAEGVLRIGPGGSRSTDLWVVQHESVVMFYTGCFGGTEAELLAAVKELHGDNRHAQYYAGAVAMARVWSETGTGRPSRWYENKVRREGTQR